MTYLLYDPSKSKKDETQEPNLPISDASERLKSENPNLNQKPNQFLNESLKNKARVSSCMRTPSNPAKISAVPTKIMKISDDDQKR